MVYLKRHGSPAAAVALGIAGFFGGMVIGWYAGGGESKASIAGGWLGGTGGAIAGAYGGKKLVEHTVTIHVNPVN